MMKEKRITTGIIAMLIIAVSHTAGATTTNPQWSFDGAYQRQNAFRGEIILNAQWLYRKSDESGKIPSLNDEGWGKRLVPGHQDGRKKVKRGWYAREIVIPAQWRGRKLMLDVGIPQWDYASTPSYWGQAVVYLDGVEIGTATGERTEFVLPDLKSGSRHWLVLRTKGQRNDLWLKSFPQTAEITESYIQTSFRKKEVKIDASGTFASPNMRQIYLTAEIAQDQEFKNVVKTISSRAIPVNSGKWSTTLIDKWHNPKTWSPQTPNLYYYRLTLYDQNKKPVDMQLARRFGFREFWVEGKDFLLNGVPFHFKGTQGHIYQSLFTATNPDYLGFMTDIWKRNGLNGFMQWYAPLDIPFDVADEKGLVSFFMVRDPASYNPWVSGKQKFPDWDQGMARVAFAIKRMREHPSIIAWMIHSPYSVVSQHPDFVGRFYDPADYSKNPEQAQIGTERYLKVVQEIEDTLDATRPCPGRTGKYTPFFYSTCYLETGMDLQERATYYRSWAADKNTMPIYLCEFSLPFEGEMCLRKGRHDFFNNFGEGQSKAIYLEILAMFEGDRVYDREPEDVIYDWPKTWFRVQPYLYGAQKLRAINGHEILRNYRTYGISWNLHSEFPYFFEMPDHENYPQELQNAQKAKDPRRRGSSIVRGKNTWHENQLYWEINEAGKKILPILAPLVAYIGGGEGLEFSRKDHLYYSGAPIKKEVVIINDYIEPVKLSGQWKAFLSYADPRATAPVARGKIETVVGAGKIKTAGLPIEFTAPNVQEKTDFIIELELKADQPGTLVDSFAVTVFPEPPKQIAGLGKTEIFLLDNEGNLAGALEQMQLKSVTVSSGLDGVTPSGLLIIGRHMLENTAAVKQLENAGFDSLVERGLRVLIMEQATENLFGLKLQERRWRRAFIAAKGHPALAGLSDEDFSYWSGDSDLTPPRDTRKIQPGWNEWPDHYWHVGSDNAVMTYLIERPEIGAGRALLVCGFDLKETPLYECVRGKGRMIFCQLDISNRIGKDPAATKTLRNIIKYLANAPAPDPETDPIVELTAAMPQNMSLTRKKVLRLQSPPGPLSWGITRGDLFMREAVFYPETKINHVETETGPAAIIAVGDKTGCTLAVEDFKTGWQKMKVMWVHSALKINSGGSSDQGPKTALHGDTETLYPVEWKEGFLSPYINGVW